MRCRLLLGLLLAGWLGLASAASASADDGWTITSFHSDIVVLQDSTIDITETISVDFGSLSKHGIYRTIPLRYQYDDKYDRLYEMSLKSVTRGTTPVPYVTSFDGVDEVIQIGDPDRTVTSFNNYTIHYSLAGVMNPFGDHDELYWNVDGGGWNVPKRSVSATIHIPKGSFWQAACYEGVSGASGACDIRSGDATVDYASTRELGIGEQMSVVVALQKGAVSVQPPILEALPPPPPPPRSLAESFLINPPVLIISSIIVLVGVGLMGWIWWMHGRDREYLTQYYLTNDPRERTDPLFHHHVITVEFGPPSNLPPAMLGLLLDEAADAKDITASIVDLAVKGYLTITEVPGQKDWIFTWKGGDMSKLLPYEQTLLAGIFCGLQQASLSKLRGQFATTLKAAKKQICDQGVTWRFFSRRPDVARGVWIGFAIAVLSIGATLMWLLGVTVGWGLVGAAIVIVGLAMGVLGWSMPQRTAAGSELLQRTLGFRLYMTTAERYRQQFAEKAEIFTQLLPYAIVFGCVAMWAKAFEGLDTTAGAAGWYLGAGPFEAAVLATSLESMNINITSAISTTPGGSGASGLLGLAGAAAGFAGGGGGGGGGGSW